MAGQGGQTRYKMGRDRAGTIPWTRGALGVQERHRGVHAAGKDAMDHHLAVDDGVIARVSHDVEDPHDLARNDFARLVGLGERLKLVNAAVHLPQKLETALQ